MTQLKCPVFLVVCAYSRDCIEHYLYCDSLWSPIFQQLNISPYSDMLERLAIKNCCSRRTLTLAVAFVVYHKFRSQARASGVQLTVSAAAVRESTRTAASLVKFRVSDRWTLSPNENMRV